MSVSETEKVNNRTLHCSIFSSADYSQDDALITDSLSVTQDPAALRENGNSLFKAGDMQGAICCYTKALKLSDNREEKAVLYRNRSACYLKLEEYNKAETDASKGGTHH